MEVYFDCFLNFGNGIQVNGQGYAATTLLPGTRYKPGWSLQLMWLLHRQKKCPSAVQKSIPDPRTIQAKGLDTTHSESSGTTAGTAMAQPYYDTKS